MSESGAGASAPSPTPITLGLRANWKQFSLLVLINAFVGGMVGLQSTVVPLIGADVFKIASTAAVLSFIVSFGIVKACANLVSGQLADYWGRKRVLIVGWLCALPVPFMIIFAPTWEWVIAANALLGISQGFAWSMTVLMKVDLVGPKGRGLAVGLNECFGYLAVGLDPAERADVEQHTADCGTCAQAVADARAVDSKLCTLIAGIRPRPGLEDRMIQHLRERPRATIVVRAGWDWVGVEGQAELAGPDDPLPGVDAEGLRLLLREIFAAAGGTHDDWPRYDQVMAEERRTAVLVTPSRISTNSE